MFLKGSTIIKSMIILCAFSINSLFATGWFQIYEDSNMPRMNGASLFYSGIQQIYAVGENGSFYYTEDGGYSWTTQSTGTSLNLNAITTTEDYLNDYAMVHIAVGENGAVMKYSGLTDSWTSIRNVTSETLLSVEYDSYLGRIWVGGVNGAVHYSLDYGNTWISDNIDTSFTVKEFIPTYNGMCVLAERNDTTFVLRKEQQTGMVYSYPGDTLPDFSIKRATFAKGSEYTDQFYVAGINPENNLTSIWRMYVASEPIPERLFAADFGPTMDFTVFGYDELKFWITTKDGMIWETKGDNKNWKLSYQDQDSRSLGPIVCSGWTEDPARVLGNGGLVLKYGFELRELWPDFNRNLQSDFSQIYVSFSNVPDLKSIEKGVRLFSNQRGALPLSASYAVEDSKKVYLDIFNENGPTQIPGEKFNISFSDSIYALGDSGSSNFKGFNYDVTLLTPFTTPFQFNEMDKSNPIGKQTTNWVTGFINNDETLDLLTFADDTLYCFVGADSARYDVLAKVPMPNTIYVDINKREQLILVDINFDGLLDLVMYDNADIFIVMNRSTASDVKFEGPTASFSDEFVTRVIPYNANNNELTDLMILGLTFQTRFDVTENSFGENYTTHDFGSVYHRDIGVADIDSDGQMDLIIVNNDGNLDIRRGYGYGYFDTYEQAIIENSRDYLGVKIAELDDDRSPEILAFNNSYIDLYTFDWESQEYWSFQPMVQDIVNTGQASMLDFYIQDFGGNRDYEFMRLDMLVLTPDSIFIYENQTSQYKNFLFTKHPDLSKSVDVSYDYLLAGDFDKNAAVDFAAYDIATGQFKIWDKFTWQPEITSYNVSNHRIELFWTPFPSDAGTIDYYNIARDYSPDFLPDSYIRQSNVASFVDQDVHEFDAFWYSVQAVYNNGALSQWSAPINIETFYELNGSIFGSLEDTTRPYLVKTSILVESGNSLEIGEGIVIGFEPDTRFDVYGGLSVLGTEIDDHMVDFRSVEGDSGNWDGIFLHPAADTVNFTWFSVGEALNGIQVDNRPVKMKFGGIFGNQYGLSANGDTLDIQNIIFDSNYVAIRLTGTARANFKNINILHSFSNSLTTDETARAKVRNSIIWDNVGGVIKENLLSTIRLTYSTVDRYATNVQTFQLNDLPPVFMPSDSGYFRVAYDSPTIDAGDPNDDFEMEPLPNGGRVNQGLFGGSHYATPSFQPRVKTSQEAVFLEARPAEMDSTILWIHNPGGSALSVQTVELLSSEKVFNIFSELPGNIAAGDSATVKVVFSPLVSETYFDTLRVYCDDPHLAEGFIDVRLVGRGSDVVPVVKLDSLNTHIFYESAMRFWYSVVDSGSGYSAPSTEGTYLINYVLLNTSTLDTISGQTSSPDHIDFISLEDGKYLFKIWAVSANESFNSDFFAKRDYFSISINSKYVKRFRWYMMSFPRNYNINWNWFELGDSSVYMLEWDQKLDDYVEVDIRDLKAGKGYWAFPLKVSRLEMNLADSSFQAHENIYVSDSLKFGWNQVGVPRDYKILWNQIDVYSLQGAEMDYLTAAAEGYIDSAVYWYREDDEFQGYEWTLVDSSTKAEPWRAYWVYANEPCILNFPMQPAYEQRNTNESATTMQKAVQVAHANQWQIILALQNEHYADNKNVFGIGSNGTKQVQEPPHIGDYCALYIPSENGKLTQDIQPVFKNETDVKEWNILVRSRNNTEQHTLSWDAESISSIDIYLYLVDEAGENVIDMKSANSYDFSMKGNSTSFKLYATQNADFKPEVIPQNFTLLQNYPNPFNPETTIRFGIPPKADGKKATLSVFNVLGQKIATIYSGKLKMGYHEFVWNGMTFSGTSAASGVYFYRLNAGGTHLIKKMVLVR